MNEELKKKQEQCSFLEKMNVLLRDERDQIQNKLQEKQRIINELLKVLIFRNFLFVTDV